MAQDVFISYSNKDEVIAERAYEILEANGIKCWIANRDTLAGTIWGKAISDAIKASRAMVLIFSSNANTSKHVEREVELADSEGIPIITFRIETVAPTGSLEYFLRNIQWLTAGTPLSQEDFNNLTKAVERILKIDSNAVANPNGVSPESTQSLATRTSEETETSEPDFELAYGGQAISNIPAHATAVSLPEEVNANSKAPSQEQRSKLSPGIKVALVITGVGLCVLVGFFIWLSRQSGSTEQVIPQGSIDTATLDFRNQAVGIPSNPESITLANTGSTTLLIKKIYIAGDSPGDFSIINTYCSSSLGAGAKCRVVVGFTPKAAGPRKASLIVEDNSAESPKVVSLFGTGILPVISFNPEKIDFGNREVDRSGEVLTLTMINKGTVPLRISKVTVTGINANDFTIDDKCPHSSNIDPNDNCIINIKFTPGSLGPRNALLTFFDNAAEGYQNVQLTGTGIRRQP